MTLRDLIVGTGVMVGAALAVAAEPGSVPLIGVAVVGASAVAVGYLARVYRRQEAPRSVVFRALLGIAAATLAAGAWFVLAAVWLAVFGSPILPREVLTPVNSAVLVGLLASPVYYAWIIRRIRRGADA